MTHPCRPIYILLDDPRVLRVTLVILRKKGFVDLNLGQVLCQNLLDVPPLRRSTLASEEVQRIVRPIRQPLFIWGIDALFQRELSLNVPQLIDRVARRTPTTVVAWPGYLANSMISYAAPGHSDHRTWPASGITFLTDPREIPGNP
ncbi:BREX-3 system P-loop-containing protein BrxF [Azospirillum sp. BE72]|uniref:BREX-3 system P-loop-containing protein BrxF n=1 Tax=Azospirillum sp. BE72 TaxID=2817776 RepID=UPI0038D4E20E